MKAAKVLCFCYRWINWDSKILFHRKMKNLLLTFALFMQKQNYYYCWGCVSQVLQNWKTRRTLRYWRFNYEERWFEKMIEFRMLPSTFHFIVNLVEVDTRKEDAYFRKTISIQKRVASGLWRLSTGNS